MRHAHWRSILEQGENGANSIYESANRAGARGLQRRRPCRSAPGRAFQPGLFATSTRHGRLKSATD
jgi:hypothetical protein